LLNNPICGLCGVSLRSAKSERIYIFLVVHISSFVVCSIRCGIAKCCREQVRFFKWVWVVPHRETFNIVSIERYVQIFKIYIENKTIYSIYNHISRLIYGCNAGLGRVLEL
jgi:hypothetical protein